MTTVPLSTYPALLVEIADWLNRPSANDPNDPDVAVNRPNLGPIAPTLVKLAEVQMRRRLDDRQMTSTIQVAIDSGGGFDLPADFGGMSALAVNGINFPQLIATGQNALVEQAHGFLQYGGRPRYYSLSGGRVNFAPANNLNAGDLPMVLTMTYRRTLPALSVVNPVNWMLRDNPDVYLFGALMCAASYLRDDDRVSTWANMFGSALEDVGLESMKQAAPAVLRTRVGMIV